MIKKKKKLVKVDEITDYVCNKCGQSCRRDLNFYGLLEVVAYGGYDSEKIGDENSWTFSVCEDCLSDFVKTFEIPPEEAEHILGIKIQK